MASDLVVSMAPWMLAGPSAKGSIDSPAVVAIIAGIFGLFGGGALATLLKVNVDRHKIVIEAAQGAVVVQSGVIDDLNTELRRIRAEADAAWKRADGCQREVRKLRSDNVDLRKRVDALEAGRAR